MSPPPPFFVASCQGLKHDSLKTEALVGGGGVPVPRRCSNGGKGNEISTGASPAQGRRLSLTHPVNAKCSIGNAGTPKPAVDPLPQHTYIPVLSRPSGPPWSTSCPSAE